MVGGKAEKGESFEVAVDLENGNADMLDNESVSTWHMWYVIEC